MKSHLQFYGILFAIIFIRGVNLIGLSAQPSSAKSILPPGLTDALPEGS